MEDTVEVDEGGIDDEPAIAVTVTSDNRSLTAVIPMDAARELLRALKALVEP